MSEGSTGTFPFPVPDPLPVRIDPCPIVEAIFELRFSPTQPWMTLPGLLYAQIREHYAEQRPLRLAQVPEDIRRQEAAFANLPLTRFIGNRFLIQLGPRVVSLATKANAYPGWAAIKEELSWLLERVQAAGIVAEGERLGVRYIDFFPEDLFPHLHLEVTACGAPWPDTERQLTTVFREAGLTLRLMITNSAIVPDSDGHPRKGSVLDVDGWFGALEFEAFGNSLDRFDMAHLAIKRLFFSLLKADYLIRFKPEYA